MKQLPVLLALTAVSLSAALLPARLECEARVNPVGIDTARPRLGWALKSDGNGARQTAYQILVAGSMEALKPGSADLWDSGRVSSANQSWIEYAGKPLQPFQHYYWTVRVWDAAGRASGWSEPAQWTTALLQSSDMRGSWIAHPDHSLRSGPLPIFRREFRLEKPLRSAVVLVAGAGFHELRINGQKVGDHVLAPAWTNFRSTMLYETFDVKTALRPGRNALGVLLGNGFYNVAGGRYVKYSGSFGHPRLWLQLHLEYRDGSTQDIATDGSWKTADGPITFSCLYGGEDYDARREQPGWDSPGFDDSTWRRAGGVEAPGGVLRAQSSPAIRVQQTYPAVQVTEPKPGVYVYDLGQNFSGWPRVTASGPAGSTVKMIPGELLDKDGLVTQRSSGGPNSFSYTLKGEGREVWSPRFSYYGFRYVQVEGLKPEAVEGQFVHLDAPRTGKFECSNETFNRVHKLIDAAVRSNLQHSLTDCPHREKLGWLEQTYLMGPSILANWDLRAFLPKMTRDMHEAQTVDGLVPDIAPEYVTFGRGFRDSPEWGSAAVLVPWLAWQWYGDRRILEDAYPMMQRYSDYLESQKEKGLLSYGLGDWYDIGPKAPGYSQLTPQGVTASATYLEDLRVVRQAAALLGKPQDAQRYAARYDTLLAAFKKEFYQPGGPSYATGSQTSLAVPLAMGIAPAAARPKLVEKLVADIRAKGNHTSAGDIGYHYVLAALLQAGRSDVIFDMANEKTAPSYAAQLAAGSTALTEAWDSNPNSSQNHFMLGHIEEWFYAGLAGLRTDPAAPGLSHLILQPEPVGDVTWAKASWDSPRGLIAVEWRIEGGKFRYTVDLPPGVSAEVRMPAGAPKAIGSGHHSLESAFQAK
ncbi:family 78 glycoside hydrolase catalytic domain [Paludibaculum fermentans]|uniref:alpha-L-rhamnosidase n=1 Tax=Paludibaculum fermentans TaxID=1473598 RepID=A0A7S7NW43_PALFE|nr:family 78 glycoside hydrolase catalytic domain [Paludibaculum fermentans]QOY90836.1 family 78 glycoside hydrolase catalytic domain [Paludibaculum fermentans]